MKQENAAKVSRGTSVSTSTNVKQPRQKPNTIYKNNLGEFYVAPTKLPY